MASSKLRLSSSILIFSLFIVSLSTFSSACDYGSSPPVHPKSPPPVKHSPPPTPKSPPPVKHSPPPTPKSLPKTSVPPPSPPKSPSPSPPAVCPINTLKLGVCANLLGSTIVVIGLPTSKPCCTLLNGLTDLQAALCLCTAIKADVLGIHLNVMISLSVILNDCGKKFPSGFKCA